MISEVKSSAQELNKGLFAFNKDQAENGALNYLGKSRCVLLILTLHLLGCGVH